MNEVYAKSLRGLLESGWLYLVVKSAWNEGDWIDESETEAWLDRRLTVVDAYERNSKEGLSDATQTSWSVKRVRLRTQIIPPLMSAMFDGLEEAEDGEE